MSLVILTVFVYLFAVVFSRPQDASSPTASSDAAQSTICGDIIAAVGQGQFYFDAEDAYDCLTSVPFNAAVASRFIEYYNTTLQFQSTLAYLKDPPQGYQQPAVDVLYQLELIQRNVTAGYYKNEYAFEADLQLLVYAMHDTHVALTAGALAAFSFASPYLITSASVDGRKPPQVFLTDDVIASQREGWEPSPLASINGQDVVEYLTKFAALNSAGTLEPHADWNQLMNVPALDIQGFTSVFGGAATFYPGDYLNFTFANGTPIPTYWLAIYNNPDPTGPLETSGDFFNYFVLGYLPASYNPGPDSGDGTDGDSPTGSISLTSFYNASSGAYPENPDIVQPDLSVEGGGILTGYFLHDVSVAVLSVPTFEQSGYDIGNFSSTVTEFIDKASEAKLSKVIIDLQQNTGGNEYLVFDMFRQFFPTMDPFAGSRRRSHELANILGGAITDYFDRSHDETYSADEWVVTDRLNAETGQNFTSWGEYFGPLTYQADNFSLTERYNLSSEVFDEWAFDGWLPYGYTSDTPVRTEQQWDADDIVLLTDGICASSCSLFLEMMVHQAGAHTIVVGGRPETGPMQAASGTRGAQVYSADDLDDDFQFASSQNDTANSTLPPRDLSFYVTYAGFNLRDQVRPNDSTPLQFKYEAADCRIYYNLANVYNMPQLWRDAAKATWEDRSLCVEGSTGYSTPSNGTTTSKTPPAPIIQLPTLNSTSINRLADFGADVTGGLEDGYARSVEDITIVAIALITMPDEQFPFLREIALLKNHLSDARNKSERNGQYNQITGKVMKLMSLTEKNAKFWIRSREERE
ncbi:MAG: hypothetical protein M1821_002880 [Bathelium mastoideum]|nr:MAG: hypothetical protein M1821_002880 [Bathelium mastoideum]